jgi:hypothetical protein
MAIAMFVEMLAVFQHSPRLATETRRCRPNCGLEDLRTGKYTELKGESNETSAASFRNKPCTSDEYTWLHTEWRHIQWGRGFDFRWGKAHDFHIVLWDHKVFYASEQFTWRGEQHVKPSTARETEHGTWNWARHVELSTARETEHGTWNWARHVKLSTARETQHGTWNWARHVKLSTARANIRLKMTAAVTRRPRIVFW